jgi:hypothetical protein
VKLLGARPPGESDDRSSREPTLSTADLGVAAAGDEGTAAGEVEDEEFGDGGHAAGADVTGKADSTEGDDDAVTATSDPPEPPPPGGVDALSRSIDDATGSSDVIETSEADEAEPESDDEPDPMPGWQSAPMTVSAEDDPDDRRPSSDEPDGVASSEPAPSDQNDGEEQQQLFGEVSGLFDRLRVDPPTPEPWMTSDDVDVMMNRRLTTTVVDVFDVRDRLLLPVGNRALRNIKRQLTEAQNLVLEEVRLDETGWEPDDDVVRTWVRADLAVLFAESFGAGHAAAEEMLGGKIPRPATPHFESATEFVEALSVELRQVLTEGRMAGQGGRQLGASLSRVFRAWRTDQSERRVRELSLTAYHQGVSRSLELGGAGDPIWVVSGRGCATCRAAKADPPASPPPAHPGCECTISA